MKPSFVDLWISSTHPNLQIEHQAHGAKTSDPVINRTDDDLLILKPSQTLAEGGVKHETEIAFFKRADYMAYQANPDIDLVHTMNQS